MSLCEKETYLAEKRQKKRQEKERSKEAARVEASVEAHSSAWVELPTLLAATEAELARTGKGVAAVVTATALQAQIVTLGGGIDTPDGMFPMSSYVGIDFTYSVPLPLAGGSVCRNWEPFDIDKSGNGVKKDAIERAHAAVKNDTVLVMDGPAQWAKGYNGSAKLFRGVDEVAKGTMRECIQFQALECDDGPGKTVACLPFNVRGATDSTAEQLSYCNDFPIFQARQVDHVYSCDTASNHARTAIHFAETVLHRRASFDEAFQITCKLFMMVNAKENQSVIPAFLNYTRAIVMRACCVTGQTYEQYRNAVIDGHLPYGFVCRTIGATLKGYPLLEEAERNDMLAKTIRIASESGRQAEVDRLSDRGFNVCFWKTMQVLALQGAEKLAAYDFP